MRTLRLLFVFLAFASATANTLARQDPAPVKRAIENFLRVQIKGLPGLASFSIGAVAPDNQLVPCASFDVTMPAGARPWGRTQVTVRCQAEGGWSLFVPVHIKVSGNYLVTARPMAQGQMLQESDLARQSGDLSEMPAGIITDPTQAIGRTLAMPLPAGRPLRGDMLRQTMVVLQNQSVKVIAEGSGFSVANEGRALTNAAEGQVVQVRLSNGQVVSGIARADGTVEVKY
ncbi:MAG: flagellar basal body P-ring formation protein FlgA [Gammaproteobacteria bacterium]|nr:flagellar basal body P-ring formation protein FlgA [Gammaproteobacteria bacterium]MBU1646167.1 flagellar basal body P-ring formation protein FlgA [Gammaproteobacteria bacterium]MBU1972229.1 flagellar basal body P-ring formation protein FlgA [Gammaproteobacteria bacterium]